MNKQTARQFWIIFRPVVTFYNMKVLKVGAWLIVWRMLTVHDVVDVTDYRQCSYCFAFVTKKEMRHHGKLGPAKTGEDDG